MTDTAPPIHELLDHHDWVVRLARALSRDPASADDLAQDAWVRAMEKPPADASSPRAWLATVVRNLARNRHRGDERRARRESGVQSPGVAPDPAALVARAEAHSRAVDAVVALPEPYRTTVLVHYFEDLSVRDVAARTGASYEAAKKRLQRAHGMLREQLDEQHDGDRCAWLLPLLRWDREPAPARLSSHVSVAASLGLVAGIVACLVAVVVVLGDDPDGPRSTESTTALEAANDASQDRSRVHTSTSAGGETEVPASGDPESAVATNRSWRVSVRDTNGRVVSGAPIELYHSPPVSAASDVHELWWETRVDSEPDRLLLTDDAGCAEIAPSDAETVLVLVRHPDHAESGTTLRRDPPQGAERDVELVLGEPHTLRGRVVDENGAGVAGLVVHAMPRGSFGTVSHWRGRRVTQTDAAGAFRVANLSEGDWTIALATDDTLRFAVATVALPDPVPVEIVLPRGGELHGTVTDASDGAPVAGATVEIRISTMAGRDTAARVTTDARGEYAYTTLFPGQIVGLDVWGIGHMRRETVQFGATEKIEIGTGDRVEQNVELVRGGTLKGQVRGRAGPVAGVLVGAQRRMGRWPMSFGARTDAEGRYRLDGLPPETLDLGVEWTQPAEMGPEPRPEGGSSSVTLEPGSAPLEVNFVPSDDEIAVVQHCGRIVDVDGNPVLGAVVGPEARVDPDGRFRVAFPATLDKPSLFVRADGWAVRLVRSKSDDDGDGEVELGEIVLRRRAMVRGCVRDAKGEPIPNADVWLGEYRENLGVGRFIWFPPTRTIRHPGNYWTRTDERGEYELLATVGEGRLSVRARAAGLALGEAEAAEHPGHPEVLRLDVVLRPAEQVSGRVVDAVTGQPIAGARVGIIASSSMNRSAHGQMRQGTEPTRVRTDAEGRFTIGSLDRRAYIVGAMMTDYLGADAPEVELPTDGPLMIELEPLYEISGVVVDQAGTPLRGALVRVFSFETRGFFRVHVRADENGAFRVRGLRQATYRIVVPDIGKGPYDVKAGTTDARFVIEPFPPEDDPEDED